MQDIFDGAATTADIPFHAWAPEPGTWSPPTAADWPTETQQHLTALHIAWAIMHKDVTGVQEALDEILVDGPEAAEEAVEALYAAAAYFGSLSAVLESAVARITVAGTREDFLDARN